MRLVNCGVPCNGHVTVALRLSQDSGAAERQERILCLFRGVHISEDSAKPSSRSAGVHCHACFACRGQFSVV